MPSFVEEAVMAGVYIVAGTSKGQVNISPKLVFKCLMLAEISVETVRPMEYGYEMSERQAQRLAQTVRFILDGITHRVQEYENQIPDEIKENITVEKKFIADYYSGRQSSLYAPPMASVPMEILNLNKEGKYLEYGVALREFRRNNQ